MRLIDTIIVHCAATPPSLDWGADDIRRLHTDSFGWSDIGYHYVIRRDGTLEHGRDVQRKGAHAKGRNEGSIGICLVGGVDEANQPDANFTDAQMKTLRSLIIGLKDWFDIREVMGHRDTGAKKACPSFGVGHWLAHDEVKLWP